jgi:outer membrane receptor protein involved in Fe transport
MQFKIPHKRRLLCTAISMSLLPLAGTSLAQDQQVEEVVVTGSFIRRSAGFTQASQTTQLDAEDLLAQGTLNIGEVIQNLTFVNGASSAVTNTIQGTDSRSSSIDLRGLGASSTLTLLDGKRLVNQNVNALIPTIAIQRMDIVVDGAAALYGNEAVAGVVNFIPYKSYDGFKLDTYAEQTGDGDYDEHSVQMMWGGDIGDLDVVLAGQFRQNSRLGWDERSVLANSGLTISSNAPGNYYTPNRGADGLYTGSDPAVDRTRTPDPECRPGSERTGYTRDVVANQYGNLLGSSCFFDFGDNRSYREPTETTQFYANATWEFSDDLTISAQAFRTRLAEVSYTSTSNPGNSRIGELPVIRGEIPGNPFRALDSNGNQLYGFDADGNGVPDRGTADLNGDGQVDYLVAGITPNGIPLNEDVVPRTLRPINKTNALGGHPEGWSPDMDNLTDSTDTITRFSLQADFTVPFIEGWEGQASWTSNSRDLMFLSQQNYDITEMIKGLNCDTVNDRAACYNPFFVTNAVDATATNVIEAIGARDAEWIKDDLDVIDIILNGEIPLGGFELPGGPIGAAIGYQWRDNSYTNIPSLAEIAGDTWIGSADKEFITSGNREVDAYFAEFSIPVLSTVEVSAAVRREEFSTGQASTDPKYGITWQATDWLTLRATQGSAFIAPSLEQLLNPVTCGLSTVTDRFTDFDAFTTACGGGNRNLTNEVSDSQQLGFNLTFDNFDLAITWNETDFSNRIINTSSQDIMSFDFFAFQQATGFAGDGLNPDSKPSLAQLAAWVANPASNKDIIRDPGDPATILQINGLGSGNAETVRVTAFDLQANYTFSLNDWGDFRVGLQGTFIDEFLYQSKPTDPIRDGAGNYNDTTGAAPNLPQTKVNLQFTWTRGNHSINTITRYVGKMDNYDGPLFTHLDAFGGFNRPAGIRDTNIKAWSQLDANYTFRGLELFDGEMSFSVGGRNLFDREPQRSPEFAGVLGQLQDPLNRVFYARMVYDF